MTEYKGGHMVVIANNSRLPIAHINKTIIVSQLGSNQVPLQNFYNIPIMKTNLLSMVQLIASGHYVLFGPHDVNVYQDLKISGRTTMEER